MSGIVYDPGTDYREKINKARADGNFERASILEAMRNAKIEGEGLSWAPTYEFTTRTAVSDSPDSGAYLKSLYGAKKQKALEALHSEYEKNASGISEEIGKIAAAFASAKNGAAADSDKSAGSWNEHAAAKGLVSLGGQAKRARENALRGRVTKLRADEADKIAVKERKKKSLYEKYLEAIAKAEEKSDLELSQAVLKEYRRAAGR